MMVLFVWTVLLTLGLGSLGTLGNGSQFYYQGLSRPDPAYRYKNKQKRESSNFYKVDTLIIVDFSLNVRLRNIISEYFPSIDDSNEMIRNYYMLLIDRVNRRFSLLDDSQFMIRIAVTDIYIAGSIERSPWSSTIQSTSEISATRAVEELYSWLRTGSHVAIQKNITVIALTAMKIVDNGNRTVQGISQNGSICSESNIIILHDTFDFILATVAAHYIARSLGANEDGRQNNCSADNHFIMSTPNMATTGQTKSNPWKFSECSKKEIKNYISSLSNTCLTRLVNISDILITLPGSSVTVDQQCQIIKGEQSYMCRVPLGGRYEEMCTGMYCYNPIEGTCDLVVPHEGTFCGNGKWCINGLCASSFMAPSANAECVHKDQPVIEFSTTGCRYYINSAPSECYKGNVSLACCESCLAQVSGTKDCLYGNRISSCSVRQRDCYNASINRDCCKTCSYYETSYTDCMYGDRIGSCDSISARDCYNATINSNCCQTCRSYNTFYQDCEYGDKIAWCNSISSRDCYDASTNRDCCKSCPYYNTFYPNCEFGDRILSCSISARDCYDSAIYRDCCRSCRSYSTFYPDCEYGNRIASCESVLGMDCYNASINRNCCQTCRSFKTAYINCLYGDYVSGCRSYECSSYSTDRLNQCCSTCSTSFQRTSRAAIITAVSITNKPPDTQNTDIHEIVATSAPSKTASNEGWVAPVVGTIVGVVIVAIGIAGTLCYLRRRQCRKKPQQAYEQHQLKETTSNRPPMAPPRDSQGSGISPGGNEDEADAYIYPNDIEDASGTVANNSVKDSMGYNTNNDANEYLDPIRSSQYSAYLGYVDVVAAQDVEKEDGYMNLRSGVDATSTS